MIKLNLRLSGAATTLSTTAAGVTTTVTTIPSIAGVGSTILAPILAVLLTTVPVPISRLGHIEKGNA